MDTLADVAVFVQVVERGSFTAAANRLDLSKAVVSKYVTRLENQLGVRLLNRTTRRLSLTEAGRLFYERGKQGLQHIEEAQNLVGLLQDEPRGTLRLNAPMSFGILHVAPALGDFLARYPDLSVDLNLDDRKVDMVEEGFDVSIRITNLSDSSLIARRIAPCRHAIVAAPDYLSRRGTPQSPADLLGHHIITYRYQEAALEWSFHTENDEQISIAVTGAVRMNNSLAIREALVGGLGITRTPTFVVGRDIREGRLREVLTDYRSPTVPIYMIYPRRRHLQPKVRAFMDFMSQRITEKPYWDQF